MKWTDSDNLNGVEVLVVGGKYDGLRVTVNEKSGAIRYPAVVDLTKYVYIASERRFVEAHE